MEMFSALYSEVQMIKGVVTVFRDFTPTNLLRARGEIPNHTD